MPSSIKSERPEAATSKRSVSESDMAVLRPLTHLFYTIERQMSRKTAAGPANRGTIRRHNPREDAGRRAVDFT